MFLETLECLIKLNSFYNLDIYHIYIPALAGFASGVPTPMPVGVTPGEGEWSKCIDQKPQL